MSKHKYEATYQCRMCQQWLRQTIPPERIDPSYILDQGNTLRAMITVIEREISHGCNKNVIGIAQLYGIQKIEVEGDSGILDISPN